MLSHDDEAPNHEIELLSLLFQNFEEKITARSRAGKRLAMIATAGDEMLLATGMKCGPR